MSRSLSYIRRLAGPLLGALLLALLLTLLFQGLTPHRATFPSGRSALAFAGATVLALGMRRWPYTLLLFGGAALLAASPHPSDMLGGAMLGLGCGASSHGLLGKRPADWGWLLWLQVALVLLISEMAYLGLLPLHLLRWPLADKVMHFVLFGLLTFWLRFWLGGRALRWGLPWAILLPFSVALFEEGIQAFSPRRSADLIDLLSDLLGMLFFWWLAGRVANPD